MKQIENMKFYTLDEVTDEIIGVKGTAARDEFDNMVEETLLRSLLSVECSEH